MLPKVVVGYLLLIALGARGFIGQYLDAWFGIKLIFTTAGATVAAAVISFPLTVNAIRLALEAVDRGLEVAARTLGASRLDVFFSVTLPLMLPGILSGALLSIASALGEFGATITFVSNVEGQTRTIPLAIYSATHMPDGDAMALRLTLVSIVLALAALLAANLVDRRIRILIGRRVNDRGRHPSRAAGRLRAAGRFHRAERRRHRVVRPLGRRQDHHHPGGGRRGAAR